MSNWLPTPRKVDVLERFLHGQSYRTIQRATGAHTKTIGDTIHREGEKLRWQLATAADQIKPTVVDVVQYDVWMENQTWIALVALHDNWVAAHAVGKSIEVATTELLQKLPDTQLFRSCCEAFRSACFGNRKTSFGEVYRAPFPDQYRFLPDAAPKKPETLDAAICLVAAHHNYCGAEPTPAMQVGLVDSRLDLSTILEASPLRSQFAPKKFLDTTEIGSTLEPWPKVPAGHPHETALYWLEHCIEVQLEILQEERQRTALPGAAPDNYDEFLLEAAWDLWDAAWALCGAKAQEPTESKIVEPSEDPDDQRKHQIRLRLKELCSSIAEPPQRIVAGRPAIKLRSKIFACVTKVVSGLSCRGVIPEVQECARLGYIEHAPSPSTISRMLASKQITKILVLLARESAVSLPFNDAGLILWARSKYHSHRARYHTTATNEALCHVIGDNLS